MVANSARSFRPNPFALDGKSVLDGTSFFVLGVDHPYEVRSDETPSLLPERAVAVRFHSIGAWGAIRTGKNLGKEGASIQDN
jgi:pyruvate-ferredoxin/flavodoxin oxidoreductase